MNWYKKAQLDPNQKTIDNFNRNKNHEDAGHRSYYNSMELVPIKVLKKYREYDRVKEPKMSREKYEELKADIIENGIQDISVIQYGTKTDTAILGEGNHRLAIAEELGIEAIPVRVWRQENIYPHSDTSFPSQKVKSVPRRKNQWGHEIIPQDFPPSLIGIKEEENNELV